MRVPILFHLNFLFASNYQKLDHKLLVKLTYTCLGDWDQEATEKAIHS